MSDDDSGLIYMRARYHEPSTGRFVSEDSDKDGGNWFVYCGNDPLNCIDASGRDSYGDALAVIGNLLVGLGRMYFGGVSSKLFSYVGWESAEDFTSWVVRKLIAAAGKAAISDVGIRALFNLAVGTFFQIQAAMAGASQMAGWAGGVEKIAGYNLILYGQMLLTESEFSGSSQDWWGYGTPELP